MASEQHRQSQAMAAEAQIAMRSGETVRARELYSEAARHESEALAQIPLDKSRTRGILAVSLASLHYKARELMVAEQKICEFLADRSFSGFTRGQLRELLEAVWDEVHLETLQLESSGETVLIAHRGGQVGFGSAPPELLQHSVSGISSLYYRIAEWQEGHKLRQSGASALKDRLRARVGTGMAGSYKFTIRFSEPRQKTLFPECHTINVHRVAETFVRLLKLIVHEQEDELAQVVPDSSYRSVILKLLRNIVPSGKSVTETAITRLSSVAEPETITLFEGQKVTINRALRSQIPVDPESLTVEGVLRGLSLNKKWLQIDRNDESSLRCEFEDEMLEDVIGPMVNRKVTVRGVRQITNGASRFRLEDIELADEQVEPHHSHTGSSNVEQEAEELATH